MAHPLDDVPRTRDADDRHVRRECSLLPSIASDSSADLAITQWVVSAYVLAIAVLPASTGRMGDIFGRRRVYMVGLLGSLRSQGSTASHLLVRGATRRC